MSGYVTLKKNNSEFKKYLWGDFSNQQVALPMATLNVGSVDETITFEVIDENKIVKPSFFYILLNLIKVRNFILILVPLFYVLIKNYVDNRFYDPLSCLLATVAMLFMMAAFSIRNDVNDHMSGYDRVNINVHKPITKGWVKAHQASRLSWIFIWIAAVFSIPVMVRQPEEVRVIAVAIFLTLAGQLLSRNSYKNQRWGEIIFFILVGPGVTSGYQVALGSGIDTEVLAFGVLWAWAIQFLVHINNFSHLLTSSQAGIKNTITNAGFDRAKKILIIWWCIFILLWIGYHHYYASVFWSFLTTLILIFWSIPTMIKISEIQSPLGSDLTGIKKIGYKNFLLMAGLLVIEFYWYLGNQKDWFV